METRKPPRPITLAGLERAALHYLERYASSAENLRRVLTRKVERRCRERGEDAAEVLPLVDEVVRRAVSGGYVDDRVYTQSRVATLRRRGLSARGIAARLAQKGVDRELIGQSLDEHESDDETAAFALARRKRIGPFRREKRAEQRERDLAALARAGFSYGVARAVVDAPAPDEEG